MGKGERRIFGEGAERRGQLDKDDARRGCKGGAKGVTGSVDARTWVSKWLPRARPGTEGAKATLQASDTAWRLLVACKALRRLVGPRGQGRGHGEDSTNVEFPPPDITGPRSVGFGRGDREHRAPLSTFLQRNGRRGGSYMQCFLLRDTLTHHRATCSDTEYGWGRQHHIVLDTSADYPTQRIVLYLLALACCRGLGCFRLKPPDGARNGFHSPEPPLSVQSGSQPEGANMSDPGTAKRVG